MHKLILSFLFVFSLMTLVLAAKGGGAKGGKTGGAKGGKSGGGGSGGRKKDKTDYKANESLQAMCITNCDTAPEAKKNKIGVLACHRICEKLHPTEPTYGCHKKYCWSYCTGSNLVPNEWCYTTKTYSQSYSYVKCETDDDCEATWHCGGPCAAF